MLCAHFRLGVQKAMDVPGIARALGWAKQMVKTFPSFSKITLQITRESIDQEPPQKWQWIFLRWLEP